MLPKVEELTIGIDWNKASYTGIQTNSKKYLLSYLGGWTKQFPLSITMPCGEQVVFNSEEDIPDKTLSCSCGRDDHWFVKYTEV